MKKKNLTSLKLYKKPISHFKIIKGGAPAQTCESPCENGTDCCRIYYERTMMRPICIFSTETNGDPVH